jgi:DNA-binding NarL/FixJ family response regulator
MPVFGMEPIRIVLANHHPIIRSNLRSLLEREPAVRVIGEAADGREAVALSEYLHPDLVLLDVKLPPLNGICTAREIISKRQTSKIIFVAVLTDQEYVSEALKAGARGYVLEDVASTDLFRAIRVVAGGGSFLSPAITARLIEEHVTKRLAGVAISDYEQQLCCLLAAGYSEHEIARQLNSTPDRIRGDSQNVAETVPAVILDSIRGNHDLVERQ